METRIASFDQYLREAMRHAQYERTESGWYASIPGFQGLWATGETIEDARNDLWSALDGWIFVAVSVSRLPFPALAGASFDVEKRA